MYGPGITQPQPRPVGRGTVIWLRVLFTALPVVTLGFFAWGSLLRLAMVRKNPLDWGLMVIDAVLIIAGYITIGVAPNESSWQSNVGTMSVLVVMFGTPVYFLIADIRFWSRVPAGYMTPTAFTGFMPQNPYATGYGPVGGQMGGIPGPVPTGHQTPVPAPMQAQTPMGGQAPVPHHTPVPHQAPVAPQSSAPSVPAADPAGRQHPQAPRIDQVRAELDELSDYLRKEEGR